MQDDQDTTPQPAGQKEQPNPATAQSVPPAGQPGGTTEPHGVSAGTNPTMAQQIANQPTQHASDGNPAASQDSNNTVEVSLDDQQAIDESDEEPRRNPFLSVGKTIFSWVILPGLIVFFLHTFIFQAFYVSGSSMNPDFQDGDYLIIDKVGITLSNLKGMVGLGGTLSIKRGDVLVFRYPNSPSTFFIKRLIGLPGDRVVVKDGNVIVYPGNGDSSITLNEPYIDQTQVTQGDIDEVVEKDKYFVMGDNRSPNGSFDSREWGQLPKDDVVGVATTRLLPINELGPIKHPTY